METISHYYPDAVRTVVEPIMTNFRQLGVESFILNADVLEKQMCELCLQKFLGDGEVYIEMEEMLDLMQKSLAMTAVDELVNSGLIDSIEDETGQEIVFLTSKGKEAIDKYKREGDLDELLNVMDNGK